ncbi:MAG: hypothetical protein R3E99_14210 [Burkholderiaceae bacterium]
MRPSWQVRSGRAPCSRAKHVARTLAVDGDDEPGAVALQHALQFVGAPEQVERVDDGTDLQGGEVEGSELRNRAGQGGDHVALADAQFEQTLGDALHLFVQLAVADLAFFENQGHVIRPEGAGLAEQLGDGSVVPAVRVQALGQHDGPLCGQKRQGRAAKGPPGSWHQGDVQAITWPCRVP